MPLLMFQKQFLAAFILLGYKGLYLLVNEFGSLVRIGFLECILISAAVIAQVGQFVTHAGVCNHAVGLFCDTFQVIHGTGRDMAGKEFLGGTSAQCGTHLVKHLLLGGYLTLLRQIPGCTQCTSAGYYCDLYERVGVFKEP